MNVDQNDRITRLLARCYTGAVYDCLRERGLRDQVLPKEITPVVDGVTVAGPVFTVSGHIVTGASDHETLLAWTDLLSQAPKGSVVVCQPNDDTIAHMGELSAETLQGRGVMAYIVDGGCRDVGFIRSIKFPVWCRYLTPADVVGRWTVKMLNEPVVIGSTVVCPGDYAVADVDGVVVVPGGIALEVAEAATALMTKENAVRTAIRQGMDPREAYLVHGVF